MSRLNDLLRQVANTDPQLAKDLRRETDALADRRAFGLNFERHTPEAVELPGRPVRKNDKVRILPQRGEMPKKENERLYRVTKVYSEDGDRWADVVAIDNPDDVWSVIVDDLVVVAEFRDPIYPGLVSTGKIERGGNAPFHTVINAENYHALQALLFTHRGNADVIYIDPPYNTRDDDWKYNNNFVNKEDLYRHSKWLAFTERRLSLAKQLLNPAASVLIVTIDENEYLRLGLLLEQTFPDARIQMVSVAISPSGASRERAFRRSDEYIFFVQFGSVAPCQLELGSEWQGSKGDSTKKLRWNGLMRSGTEARRQDRPDMFYPIFLDSEDGTLHSIGDSIPVSVERETVLAPVGTVSVWPLRSDGTEGRWQVGPSSARRLRQQGFLRTGAFKDSGTAISYLKAGEQKKVSSGLFGAVTVSQRGHIEVETGSDGSNKRVPTTQWNLTSHSAADHGSTLLRSFIPGRKFPFPKSLYAVEDTLRFYTAENPRALVIDFFAGSGSTAHAVMRLNRQDGGARQSICVTNNETSADEQAALRSAGFRPGDPEWEKYGICEYITKPRIEASVTGCTPDGERIKGHYKFTDEFPMADGFEENVEFFNLTYESAMRVSSNREFTKVAPLLWLRAGSRGRRIDDISAGWDVADAYGVIANLDLTEPFIKATEAQEGLTHAFIVTDEDRLFEAMVRQLPEHVEPVRLYSSYLRNFEIEAGRAAR